jgi:hypothetical protein
MFDRLQTHGVTFVLKTGKWSRAQKLSAIKRGSHQSACQHSDFLCEEFVNMIRNGHWVLLPAHLVLEDDNLLLRPLGVFPERDRRPQIIWDYTFFSVNLDTTPLAPTESMRFGKALWLQRSRQPTLAWAQCTCPRSTLQMGSTEFGSIQTTPPSLGSCSLEPQAKSPSLSSLCSFSWDGCSPPPCSQQQQRQWQTWPSSSCKQMAPAPSIGWNNYRKRHPSQKKKGRLNSGALQRRPSLLLTGPQASLTPP